MPQLPVLVDITSENIETLRCCGIKNPRHEGRQEKNCWAKQYLAKGLRARVLVAADGRQCGYIEYLPSEYAWRAVNARGYLFIHCIWTYFRQYQHRGLATQMVEACIEDAGQSGLNGVAVITRPGPWLARSELFLKCDFEANDRRASGLSGGPERTDSLRRFRDYL